MSLKTAAFFALIAMLLLTVLCVLGFIRDLSALSEGAVALSTVLTSAIHLLAALALTVFFFVFHRAQ